MPAKSEQSIKIFQIPFCKSARRILLAQNSPIAQTYSLATTMGELGRFNGKWVYSGGEVITIQRRLVTMENLRKLAGVVVVAALCIMTGCASVPTASPDFERKAMSFTPPPGMASVYVYRPYSFAGSALLDNVSLDYKEFGTLANSTYLFGTVDPGAHVLKSKFGMTQQVDLLRFDAEPGKLYFFKALFGLVFSFEQVDEKEGRESVSGYKLSGDNTFEFIEKTGKLLPNSKVIGTGE